MNKETIQSALARMATGDLLKNATNLLATLGYRSERTLKLSGNVQDFIQDFPAHTPNTNTEHEFRNNTETIQLVCQFTSHEIAENLQQALLETDAFDTEDTRSFLFCAVKLKDKHYPRTQYAEFTREINKRFLTPTVVLFRVANRLTIAFTDRRPHKIDEDRDVLGQVTLIKDIGLDTPHRAHLDVLSELSLEACIKWMADNGKPKNFEELLAAWLSKLDTQALNKQFYQELFAWYQWAVKTCRFPEGENEMQVIRLITRLLFIWFLREKGLVPAGLFTAQLQNTPPHLC